MFRENDSNGTSELFVVSNILTSLFDEVLQRQLSNWPSIDWNNPFAVEFEFGEPKARLTITTPLLMFTIAIIVPKPDSMRASDS